MTKAKELPSQAELNVMLDYIPETGELRWKRREDKDSQWNGRYAGTKAGSIHKGGHVRIHINDEAFAGHRIIYKMAYGVIPSDMHIDHINGVKYDNRLANLRLVNNAQNQANRSADSGRRFKGVYKHKNQYKAEITHQGTRVYLGLYRTERLAAFAYDEAAREFHGDHAFFNFPELQAAG